MSLRDDNMALEKKNNVLNEIVNLVTEAGLATSNTASGSQDDREYQSPLHQANLADTEEKKKRKKKKKGKGEGTDTVIFLSEQQLVEEDDNFVMPNSMPTLETSNRFVLPERASKMSSPTIGDDNNNNSKSKTGNNVVKNITNEVHSAGSAASGGKSASPPLAASGCDKASPLLDVSGGDKASPPLVASGGDKTAPPSAASGGDKVSAPFVASGDGKSTRSSDIFYSDEEDAVVEEEEAVQEERAVEEFIVTPDLRKDFPFIYLQDPDMQLESVFVNSFSLHPEELYHIDVLVVFMYVPEDSEWRDFENLLPGMVDIRMGWFGYRKSDGGEVKTRAIAAFNSVKEADHAASFEQIDWNGETIPLKKVREVKGIIPKTFHGKDLAVIRPPKGKAGANGVVDMSSEFFHTRCFAIHPSARYSLGCIIAMETIPLDFKLKDFKKLLPRIIDFKFGMIAWREEDGKLKTRTVVAFNSVEEAKHAASLKQVMTKSGDVIVLRKVMDIPDTFWNYDMYCSSFFKDEVAEDEKEAANKTDGASSSSKAPPKKKMTPPVSADQGAIAKKPKEKETACNATTASKRLTTTTTSATKMTTSATSTPVTSYSASKANGIPVDCRPKAPSNSPARSPRPHPNQSPTRPPMRPQMQPMPWNQYQARPGFRMQPPGYGYGSRGPYGQFGPRPGPW